MLVDEQKNEKSGAQVATDSVIRLLGDDLKYVSRGGLKLARALLHWNVDVTGKVCLDVGASTGGFTDCLLQHGAAHVIAIDTGYGQMNFKLRQDSRVRLLEKTSVSGYLVIFASTNNIGLLGLRSSCNESHWNR